MNQDAESIKRELHFGSNNKLRTAFQKLTGMGYSVEDACTILADYREQAADEAPYMDEVGKYFQRHLRNISNGKYSRAEIDSHLYNQSDVFKASKDEFTDFLREMEDNDEKDDAAERYMTFRDQLYACMNRLIDSGITDIYGTAFNGCSLLDAIENCLYMLNGHSDDETYLKEAVRLSNFILLNFKFDTNDEGETDELIEIMKCKAEALSLQGKYKESDAVLDQMEQYASHYYALSKRLYVMENRTEPEIKRAGEIALKEMQNRDAVMNDPDGDLFLSEASAMFERNGAAENQKYAEEMLDAYYQQNDDIDDLDDSFYSAALEIAKSVLDNPDFPQFTEAREKLNDMGFDDEEIQMALADILLHDLENEDFDEEEAEEDAEEKLKTEDPASIYENIFDAEIEELEELSASDNLNEEGLKNAAEILIRHMDAFKTVIRDCIKVTGTNSLNAVALLLYENDVDLHEYIVETMKLLRDTEHWKERREMAQFCLDTFSFDDESYMEPFLKYTLTEDMDAIGNLEGTDRYIAKWLNEEPDSMWPVYAKLCSLSRRGESKHALTLADQAVHMEFSKDEPIRILLSEIQKIYEASGDWERIKMVNKRLEDTEID